eukprot:12243129-Ditylum_brightwellii.AAC.1
MDNIIPPEEITIFCGCYRTVIVLVCFPNMLTTVLARTSTGNTKTLVICLDHLTSNEAGASLDE